MGRGNAGTEQLQSGTVAGSLQLSRNVTRHIGIIKASTGRNAISWFAVVHTLKVNTEITSVSIGMPNHLDIDVKSDGVFNRVFFVMEPTCI